MFPFVLESSPHTMLTRIGWAGSQRTLTWLLIRQGCDSPDATRDPVLFASVVVAVNSVVAVDRAVASFVVPVVVASAGGVPEITNQACPPPHPPVAVFTRMIDMHMIPSYDDDSIHSPSNHNSGTESFLPYKMFRIPIRIVFYISSHSCSSTLPLPYPQVNGRSIIQIEIMMTR
mmetsp:Transcript_24226/g.24523  ORF Transcript_24226/g.24523 Transcript_24226/m.24523 type:complete len:174 (-) Transcript_24226:21-542(-)